MTPEQTAETILERFDLFDGYPAIAAEITAAIYAAVKKEREDCALVCDAIANDKHAQYKGFPPHAPNNEHRADTFTEGESSGAGLCDIAIRARGEPTP